jgi:ATP-dependent exoDNAse (exonuclease V) alpha subunit
MMTQLATGGRLGVAIGVAGAGKSTALAPLVDAWKEEGRNVFGITLAWRQAGDLGAAGIEERAAVAAFIKRVKGGQYALDRNSVIVVDEVGQLGTRQLLELLRVQERTGAQVVMVGDPKQCQSIEAGPVIDLLRNALGEDAIPQILTSIRQKTEREREITSLFRAGKAAEALEMKQQDGTAELVAGGRQSTVQRVAQLWRERTDANRADPEFTLTVSGADECRHAGDRCRYSCRIAPRGPAWAGRDRPRRDRPDR